MDLTGMDEDDAWLKFGVAGINERNYQLHNQKAWRQEMAKLVDEKQGDEIAVAYHSHSALYENEIQREAYRKRLNDLIASTIHELTVAPDCWVDGGRGKRTEGESVDLELDLGKDSLALHKLIKKNVILRLEANIAEGRQGAAGSQFIIRPDYNRGLMTTGGRGCLIAGQAVRQSDFAHPGWAESMNMSNGQKLAGRAPTDGSETFKVLIADGTIVDRQAPKTAKVA